MLSVVCLTHTTTYMSDPIYFYFNRTEGLQVSVQNTYPVVQTT